MLPTTSRKLVLENRILIFSYMEVISQTLVYEGTQLAQQLQPGFRDQAKARWVNQSVGNWVL